MDTSKKDVALQKLALQKPPSCFPTAFTKSPPSSGAQSIAAAREELLGLLQDVPEIEYELSLTDLVEKKPRPEDNSLVSNETNFPREVLINNHPPSSKERARKSYSRVSRRSSDGVLLNIYMPTSFARSLTTQSRSNRETNRQTSANSTLRDGESIKIGCWQILCEAKRGARRQQTERK